MRTHRRAARRLSPLSVCAADGHRRSGARGTPSRAPAASLCSDSRSAAAVSERGPCARAGRRAGVNGNAHAGVYRMACTAQPATGAWLHCPGARTTASPVNPCFASLCSSSRAAASRRPSSLFLRSRAAIRRWRHLAVSAKWVTRWRRRDASSFPSLWAEHCCSSRSPSPSSADADACAAAARSWQSRRRSTEACGPGAWTVRGRGKGGRWIAGSWSQTQRPRAASRPPSFQLRPPPSWGYGDRWPAHRGHRPSRRPCTHPVHARPPRVGDRGGGQAVPRDQARTYEVSRAQLCFLCLAQCVARRAQRPRIILQVARASLLQLG